MTDGKIGAAVIAKLGIILIAFFLGNFLRLFVLKICNDQSFKHKYRPTVRKTCPYLVSNIPKLY